MLKGKGVSRGIGIGNAKVLKNEEITFTDFKVENKDEELNYFKKCLNEVIEDTKKVVDKISGTEAEIMNAYLMILQDPTLTAETERLIKEEGYNAGYAVKMGFETVEEIFRNMEDDYMSARALDIEDMKNKVTDLNSQLKKYRSSTVTYTFGSETAVLDSDTITSWLKAEGETLTLDEEAIKAYISELANKYNTIYVPRTFHTSAGTDVTIEGNEYGYRIDQDGEYAQLLEDLKSGTAVTREPVYSKKGYQRNGTDDLAGSYIEVSLDAQHLWLYKDGCLVTETDIVSGKPVKGRETYRGAWPIAYKASPFNLTSNEYGYDVKVNYWMPFVYGQGLHDASWQSSFGGNRYKTNGSHGCINLPKDQAALIYNTIDAGYPIIIY